MIVASVTVLSSHNRNSDRTHDPTLQPNPTVARVARLSQYSSHPNTWCPAHARDQAATVSLATVAARAMVRVLQGCRRRV